MEEIKKQILKLDEISRQLEIPETERIALIQDAGNYLNNFITNLPHTIAYNKNLGEDKALAINFKKKSLAQILQLYQSEVVETGIVASSGGHLGYIPGGGIFAAALADFIAAVTNPYAGVFYASPGAVIIENEIIDWLKDIFGFPKNAVGNLASGGSISTLIALTAARDKHNIKNELVSKAVVYLSKQVHHAVQKALRIIGLGDVQLRYIPIDAEHRIITATLEQQIETDKQNGLKPFLIIATAGTTDTGSIDPLEKIAAIAKENNLWFHIDAAYGGFFILTSKKDLFNGIEKADSLVVDPHKGMFLPYGLGAVLIKDEKAVLHSNHYVANYMQDAEEEELSNSPANVSPELTKHFRGLRLWLPLQLHGLEPFIASLEEKLLLLTYMRKKLTDLGFMIGPAPQLSVSYFWFPFKKDMDEKNRQLMEAIHKDGSVFLSSSIITEKFVIRIAILSFRTKLSTIDKAVEMIKNCLEPMLEKD